MSHTFRRTTPDVLDADISTENRYIDALIHDASWCMISGDCCYCCFAFLMQHLPSFSRCFNCRSRGTRHHQTYLQITLGPACSRYLCSAHEAEFKAPQWMWRALPGPCLRSLLWDLWQAWQLRGAMIGGQMGSFCWKVVKSSTGPLLMTCFLLTLKIDEQCGSCWLLVAVACCCSPSPGMHVLVASGEWGICWIHSL